MTNEDEAVEPGSASAADGRRTSRMAVYFLLPLALLATAPASCLVAGGGNRCASLGALSALAYPLWLLYMIPTAIALWRGVPAWRSVAAVNAFAGWTVVGWVVALTRATPAPRTPVSTDVEPEPSSATGWTPQSWSPPPVGYPLPDEQALTAAESPTPAYEPTPAPAQEEDSREATWAGPAEAPAWVRDGDWPVGSLVVRLCGGFEAYSDRERVSDALNAKQAVCFLWLTLFLTDLLSPSRTLRRDSFADEMSPGIPGSSQRAQLSNRLHDLGGLHPAFARAIRADKHSVAFDKTFGEVQTRVVSDLGMLSDLAEQARRDFRFTDAEVPQVERLLDGCREEALPDWDLLDERIAKRRGTGGQLIATVRERQREDLATASLALAQTHLEGGSAARAAELLQSVLEQKPDREDVARRLVAALTAAGRMKEADAVREEFLG